MDTRRIIDLELELWNTGNTKIADELYGDQAEGTDPNERDSIRDGRVQQVAKFVAQVRTVFPDFKVDVKETFVEGDHIAFHWRATGTQKGEFHGIPGSGKAIRLSGMTLARLKDGRVASEHIYFDRLAMLQQIGAAPAGLGGSAAP